MPDYLQTLTDLLPELSDALDHLEHRRLGEAMPMLERAIDDVRTAIAGSEPPVRTKVDPSDIVEGAFAMSFRPAQVAVNLLAEIAADKANPHCERARQAIEGWRACLATPGEIAQVETDDELEVDDAGACISAGDGGFFIQTWSWVPKET